MIRSLWTAATGMQAQSLNIDVISNNLANVNTSGFKRSRADFQDLLYETLRQAGSASSANSEVPVGIQLGHGTRPASVQKIFSTGDFQHTQNELDMAIEGDGFFQVLHSDGTIVFSRDGAFKVDSQGRIVNSDGFVLQPEISVPTDAVSVSIGIDGTVSALAAGEETPSEIGSVQLARFLNPAGLESLGRNLYQTSAASGTAITGTASEDGFGAISQGYLEMSNVSVVDEMVNMITAQRAYEINSKTIRTADEMLQMANQIKR
jgi:flagellar basal-body rod protein FlgG